MGLEIGTIAALASAAAAVASGAMTFVAGQQQAKTQRQQATFARKQAGIDAGEFKRRQRRLLASARVGRGASGVRLLEGSPLLVDDDTIAEIEFGTETIRNQGEVEGTRLDQGAGQSRLRALGGLATAVGGLGKSALALNDAGAFGGFGGGQQVGGRLGATRSGSAGDGLRG